MRARATAKTLVVGLLENLLVRRKDASLIHCLVKIITSARGYQMVKLYGNTTGNVLVVTRGNTMLNLVLDAVFNKLMPIAALVNSVGVSSQS